jgi:hypothetical protein
MSGKATSNVVYAVHCKKCKHIVYVGETETMLKDRIQNHLSDIRTFKKYDKPINKIHKAQDQTLCNLRPVRLIIFFCLYPLVECYTF